LPPLLSLHLCRDKAKPNVKKINELVEAYLYAYYLSRGRLTFRLPNQTKDIWDLIRVIMDLVDYGLYYGFIELANLLKNVSVTSRRCWLEGNDPPDYQIYKIIKLDMLGYLGRSLPCKPKSLVEKDRQETIDRFKEHSILRGQSDVMNVARSLINKWTRFSVRQLNIETPPYSESASLITSRRIGGQSAFYRDIYRLMEYVTRGEPRKAINCAALREGVETQFDYQSTISWYPGSINPRDRGCITRTVSEFLYFLDRPFLEHTNMCKAEDCDKSFLHFPFSIQGIPETGWRTRCASLPWPSLVFMTELPRRAIIRGTKKDALAGSALRDFKELTTVCGKDFINSSDLASATDHLPFEVQYQMGQTIAKHWKDTIYEKYIKAGFSRSRIIDEQLDDWPGLEYFIPLKRLPTVRELAKARHGSSAPNLIRLYAKMGIRPDQEVDCLIQPQGYESTRDVLPKRHLYERFVPEGYRGKLECINLPVVTLDSKRKRVIADLNFDECLDLLASIRDWYRLQFMRVKGFLANKGQHMSLPLSWVTLAALNNACAILGRLEDPDARIFTMGDDCVFGTNNLNSVERYRKHLISAGFRINYSKDATSHCGRAVFCEYLVDNGKWVDIPRPKIITHPQTDLKGIDWLNIKDKPPKWMQSYEPLITSLRLAKYHRKVKMAMSYGFDPALPPQLGGFGLENLPGKYHEFYLMKLSNLSPTAENVIRLDKDIQKLLGLNPPYHGSQLLWDKMQDLEVFFSKTRGYKNEDVNDLLVANLLPSIIYQPGFRRDSYHTKKPWEIGNSIFEFFSKMDGVHRGSLTPDIFLKLRKDVRYSSWFLDHLKEMQLDNLEFWRKPKN
jgi:hypothetical protein